ncbi:MAG: ArsR family transcriptional regulator [Parcubacteria group bacterium]
MINISKEAQKVLETIERYGPIRSSELVKILGVSTKTIYKHLSILLDEELIKKAGTTPKVFYSINVSVLRDSLPLYNYNDNNIIEDSYIYVSASGEILRGLAGFYTWCLKNNLDFKKESKLYISQLESMQKQKKSDLYSAKKIILSGKKNMYLDDIFFSDFYTFSHFGKTKLGQLVYLGKSAQDKKLIMEVSKLVRPAILRLIEKYNIKMICFVPPTIDRKVQFMNMLKKWLKLDLVEIRALKIPDAKVAQKTLRKLEDRIENAQVTIAVSPSQDISSNVLIIDDATGSGATLNETARKIKHIAKKDIKVIGYSVVGSYKGFDVISEV